MGGAALAQTTTWTNQNKPNTDLNKPTNTVAIFASRPAAGEHRVFLRVPGHLSAAPAMKSVDTTEVPAPQTGKGSAK
jgi:hypothetical protein